MSPGQDGAASDGVAKRKTAAAEGLRDEKFSARWIELAEAALETSASSASRAPACARSRRSPSLARRVSLLFHRQSRSDLLLRAPLQDEVRDAL